VWFNQLVYATMVFLAHILIMNCARLGEVAPWVAVCRISAHNASFARHENAVLLFQYGEYAFLQPAPSACWSVVGRIPVLAQRSWRPTSIANCTSSRPLKCLDWSLRASLFGRHPGQTEAAMKPFTARDDYRMLVGIG
jgi:hypothetical protein